MRSSYSHSKSSRPSQRKMVCTDLDGTFIGDDDSMYELLDIIDENNILLVFSTGRHLPLVMKFIDEKKIRKPDACLCLVGTEIYVLEKGQFILDDRWSEIISEGWHRERVLGLLRDIKELVWQPEEFQTKFKISYFLTENQEEVLKQVISRMQKAKLEVKIIYSCDEFLDFLPLRSSKAGALRYLINRFGVKKRDTIVCGDSGNDLELFRAGFRGIIVGNAHAELKNYKGKNAYRATGQYGAGIIEGLRQLDFTGGVNP
jgi:sucrose-6F-phosphate phosphohydrolase